MKIAKVILDIQTNKFSKSFNYAICDEDAGNSALKTMQENLSNNVHFKDKNKFKIQIGSTVVVPFGKQFKLAFVVDIVDASSEIINSGKLKPVLFAVTEPYFDKSKVDFATFLSEKYLCSFATCLRMFIPTGATAKLKHVDGAWKASNHNYRKLSANFIEKYFSSSFEESSDWKNFVLTKDQANALKSVERAIDAGCSHVFVMDGVTGSGKTEVYIRAIDKVLGQGKTAIVLVPEISLTPQTVSRFRQRFGDQIAVLHSKMTLSERYNQTQRIYSGEAKLVIGARSALFCPLKNVGLIVVDEEHENSYKQDKAPRYNTRDAAEFLAIQQNAVLILGSATPSLESLHSCEVKDNWSHLQLLERTNKAPMPKIEVVDMGMEFKGGSKSLFSHKLQQALIQELKAGHKVLLFHNRRGFANYMFCRSCGYKPECPSCSTSLTYHQSFDNGKRVQYLTCHHCGHKQNVYVDCPECGSPYIAKYGAGTQNVEESLGAFFLENEIDARIVRMDADTTKEKFGHQKCLEEFARPGAAILLGTQMISKGLDFDDVTLVGVILVDTNLALPDFRSSERTFNLILQVAGRCGRANLPGKVIVQTYTPDAEAIECAANYDVQRFRTIELQKRALLKYPPYTNMINIVLSAQSEDDCKQAAQNLSCAIESRVSDDINITPATSCVLERIRNKYRYHVVVKGNSDISKLVASAIQDVKIKSSVSLTIDVDPISLL